MADKGLIGFQEWIIRIPTRMLWIVTEAVENHLRSVRDQLEDERPQNWREKERDGLRIVILMAILWGEGSLTRVTWCAICIGTRYTLHMRSFGVRRRRRLSLYGCRRKAHHDWHTRRYPLKNNERLCILTHPRWHVEPQSHF